MTPGKCPLSLYRGDTYAWRFVFWTDPEKTVPADLTGVLPKAEIRDKPGGAVIVPLACAVELPNVITAKLDATASALLPAAAAWDLQLTFPSGDVSTALAGPVAVTPDITDSTPPVGTKLRAVA
jgi:hypothetical protein